MARTGTHPVHVLRVCGLYRYRFAYEFLPILYEVWLSEIYVIYSSYFYHRRDCDNDINTKENEVCQDETR